MDDIAPTAGTTLWAGKHLTEDEELRTRRVAALLRRVGDEDVAATFESFLPENDQRWTPDELEQGAHVGPWTTFGPGEADAEAA